jgi:hypothetical protein
MQSWLERLAIFVTIPGCFYLGSLVITGSPPPDAVTIAGLLLGGVFAMLRGTLGSGEQLDPDGELIANWLERQRAELVGPNPAAAESPQAPSAPETPDLPAEPRA